MSGSPPTVALSAATLSRPRRRRRRLFRWAAILAVVLAFPAWVGSRIGTGNFAEVEPRRVFRAGQMDAAALARVVRRHQIKTVLNLRGAHPEAAWYRAEVAAVVGEGATQMDVALSSREWMSRAQAATLGEALASAERPLLIHCFNGSERTGLASAFAELLRPGGTLADARAQFSWRYLFVSLSNGVVMLRHLEAYEGWLRAQNLDHDPERFRRWISREFRPGGPGRDDWPFDPVPLIVVTPPRKSRAK